MPKVNYCPFWIRKVLLWSRRYTWWVLFLIILTVLLAGMSGILGKKIKKISNDLSKKFGKNGPVKMVISSLVVSTIFKIVFGSAVLLFLYHLYVKIFKLF